VGQIPTSSWPRPERLVRWSVVVVLGAVLVAACGGVNAGQGPLNAGGTDPGTVCVPATAGGTVTMGGEDLLNTGSTDVVIDKISLADPKGLVWVESVVLSIANNGVGYFATYPPPVEDLAQDGLDWSKRTPAIGATVAPGPEPGTTNLVTGIHLTGGSGSSMSGLVIDYHVRNGFSYRVQTPIGLVVKVPPATC
jgi:hypothetical protein